MVLIIRSQFCEEFGRLVFPSLNSADQYRHCKKFGLLSEALVRQPRFRSVSGSRSAYPACTSRVVFLEFLRVPEAHLVVSNSGGYTNAGRTRAPQHLWRIELR